MILIFIEQSTISISQINDAYLIKYFDSLYIKMKFISLLFLIVSPSNPQ
jgi:hypothetical protein